MSNYNSELELEILDKSLDAVWILNEKNVILYANPKAVELVKASSSDLIGKDFSQFLPSEISEHHAQILERFVNSSRKESTILDHVRELAIVNKDGDRIPVELKAFEISPLNNLRRFVGFMRDITERKNYERSTQLMIQTFRNLAYVDELTMIPNRRAFFETFKKIIATINRRQREAVLAIIDIDNFKSINDTYGHDIGDSVLKTISQIFQEALRIEDNIGRLGGEEFACLLPDTNLSQAGIVLERLREAVEKHEFLIFENYKLKVTVSVGYAMIPAGYMPEEVVKLADIALYEAKNKGRNMVVEFSGET